MLKQNLFFKLYSHNICTHGDRPPGRGGEAGANPKRLPELITRVKNVDADIVVFCESNGDFADAVAEASGYERIYNPKTSISELQILFRSAMFELVKSGCHNIPDVRSHYLWALLKSRDTSQKILVYAYHGSLTYDLRIEEIEEMIKISSEAGCPTIFAGDFNFSHEAEEYSIITEKLSDTSVEAEHSECSSTYKGWDTTWGGVIDYCFLTKGDFNVHSYSVLEQKSNGIILSDHCGILGEYTLVK